MITLSENAFILGRLG